MAAFDPSSFFTELPDELITKIVARACRSREYIDPPLRSDHTDIARIIPYYENDLETMGALRATNKGKPFRTYYAPNRTCYYELLQDLWKVRLFAAFKAGTRSEGFSVQQTNFAYQQYWWALHGHERAIREAANNDPDALKRALVELKETAEVKKLRDAQR